MAIFFVFQGETYKEERNGGYLWSPQLTINGRKNAGYTTMTHVRKGDFILHGYDGMIVAISIAQNDYYECNQPQELASANTTVKWDDNGYKVDTYYIEFDEPVNLSDYREWLIKNRNDDSAFNSLGYGKQQYLCHLADNHAVYLLNKAISLQKSTELLKHLNNALSVIIGEKESEYDQVEIEIINDIVEDSPNNEVPKWTGKKETQAMSVSSDTGRTIPKRIPQRAADALAHAQYKCEYNNADKTFIRKNGKPYTEPHHLIPISKYRDFSYSVDIMENIVSLCSHCHNLLHYGRFEDKAPILEKLYNERKDALKRCGLNITLYKLNSYYK